MYFTTKSGSIYCIDIERAEIWGGTLGSEHRKIAKYYPVIVGLPAKFQFDNGEIIKTSIVESVKK